MILVLGGEKGGSGCSGKITMYCCWTLTHRVLLSIGRESVNRTPSSLTSRLKPHTETSVKPSWIALSATTYIIVVDAGGADSVALRSALTVATHALLPFRPKRRDLKTLPHVEEMITLAKSVNHGLIARAVITQAPSLPSQTQRILDSKEACASFGLEPLQAFTTARNVYDDADENGSSVLEDTTDLRAIEEIELIAAELWGGE